MLLKNWISVEKMQPIPFTKGCENVQQLFTEITGWKCCKYKAISRRFWICFVFLYFLLISGTAELLPFLKAVKWLKFFAVSSWLLLHFHFFCVAVLLHVHFGSMLSWVIAKAMNLSYFQLTRMMWALFHFGVLYNTGWLNDMVPWESTSTVFQLHWRKILLYFSHSFQKQVVFNATVTQPLCLTVTFSEA